MPYLFVVAIEGPLLRTGDQIPVPMLVLRPIWKFKNDLHKPPYAIARIPEALNVILYVPAVELLFPLKSNTQISLSLTVEL